MSVLTDRRQPVPARVGGMTALLRLEEMRRLVNAEMAKTDPTARPHGRNKWTRWVNAGVIPTWQDPDTRSRYCVPEQVFDTLADLPTNGIGADIPTTPPARSRRLSNTLDAPTGAA